LETCQDFALLGMRRCWRDQMMMKLTKYQVLKRLGFFYGVPCFCFKNDYFFRGTISERTLFKTRRVLQKIPIEESTKIERKSESNEKLVHTNHWG
jgi:hypothetical protein